MYIHFEAAVPALNRHPKYRSSVKLLTQLSAPIKSDEFRRRLRFSHLVLKEGKWVLVQPKYCLPERWLICKCNPREVLISCIRTATLRVSCPRRWHLSWHFVLTPVSCLKEVILSWNSFLSKGTVSVCQNSVTTWKINSYNEWRMAEIVNKLPNFDLFWTP